MRSLADLSVLNAFNSARNQSAQEGAGEMQQVGALQGILAKVQAAKKQQEYEAAMAAAKTPEEQYAAAVKAGGPAAVMQSADRRNAQATTREATLARLAQQGQMFDHKMEMDYRNATRQEEKDAVEARWKQGRLNLDAAAQRMTGERLYHDTGTRLAPTAAPNIGAPAVAPADGSWAAQGPIPFAQLPPDQQAQVRQMRGEAAPAPVASPVAVPQPQPIPQPDGAAPTFKDFSGYIPPENSDTELRRFGGGAPRGALAQVAAASAPTPAIAPQMPQFSGSPRERAAAENRWRLQQSKPSIAGAGVISPETAARIAQQALNGDDKALTPFTRNQSAMAVINEEITKQANALGMTGGDIVGRRADVVANRTALTAVTKDLAAITPFKEMLDQNAQVAIDLGRKIAADKTSSAFINRPLLWVKNNLSDRPDIAEYLAQMHFVEVEAARVLTQPRLVGQLTEQAISDMKSILSGNMTIASTEAVINRIRADGDNRIRSMKTQQERIRAQLTGGTPRTRSDDPADYSRLWKR